MNKFKKNILFAFIFILVVVVVILLNRKELFGELTKNSPEEELQAALVGTTDQTVKVESIILNTATSIQLPELIQDTGNNEAESETTSVLTTKDIPLCDLYAIPGQIVRFRIFYEAAENYSWQIYNIESKDWLPIAASSTGEERDELGRMVSYVDLEATHELSNLMIRCQYEVSGEQISEVAFLNVLQQGIREITLADSITTDAGDFLDAYNIPVKVIFDDHTSEMITGLYGLYFQKSEIESTDTLYSNNGILTERQTLVNQFLRYHYVSVGAEDITLAYISSLDADPLRLIGKIIGTDDEPPEISEVNIIFNDAMDAEETVLATVMVTASDNVTPYPQLEYAIVFPNDTEDYEVVGKEIAEGDWIRSPKVTMELQREGAWILYCRDQAGNISSYDESLFLTEKLPEIEKDIQAPIIQRIYVEAN